MLEPLAVRPWTDKCRGALIGVGGLSRGPGHVSAGLDEVSSPAGCAGALLEGCIHANSQTWPEL